MNKKKQDFNKNYFYFLHFHLVNIDESTSAIQTQSQQNCIYGVYRLIPSGSIRIA